MPAGSQDLQALKCGELGRKMSHGPRVGVLGARLVGVSQCGNYCGGHVCVAAAGSAGGRTGGLWPEQGASGDGMVSSSSCGAGSSLTHPAGPTPSPAMGATPPHPYLPCLLAGGSASLPILLPEPALMVPLRRRVFCLWRCPFGIILLSFSHA